MSLRAALAAVIIPVCVWSGAFCGELTGEAPQTESQPLTPGHLPPSDFLSTVTPSTLGLPFDLTGFWETRAGIRTQRDPHQRDITIGETRLQMEFEHFARGITFELTADFLYDPVLDHHSIDLEKGRGAVDLRKASVAFSPAHFIDVKIGRQILTWGTGDFLFLNDLFPKDWNAFFIGRDKEYLKAPSDALRVGLFGPVNLEIIYVPRFDADRFIDGRRVSYWNSALGRRAGRDAIITPLQPARWFHDDELAARLYKNLAGVELAAYAYSGFWKSPGGSDPLSGKATFPDLAVYGASLRTMLFGGIANLEYARYDSRDDSSGTDPLIRNSEDRFLLGYERELARDLTLGLQYYLEHMKNHTAYKASLPGASPAADRDRHVFTIRLTQLMMNQNLELSLFTYYSPSDDDAYFRPRIHYKIDDHWSVEFGGNFFAGEHDYTFFSQFARNNNIYAAVRYGF